MTDEASFFLLCPGGFCITGGIYGKLTAKKINVESSKSDKCGLS
jgi:hypothetical protein